MESMNVIFINKELQMNCKTIGNYDKLLVKSKWYRPILTDNYYFNIIAERPDLNIKHRNGRNICVVPVAKKFRRYD